MHERRQRVSTGDAIRSAGGTRNLWCHPAQVEYRSRVQRGMRWHQMRTCDAKSCSTPSDFYRGRTIIATRVLTRISWLELRNLAAAERFEG